MTLSLYKIIPLVSRDQHNNMEIMSNNWGTEFILHTIPINNSMQLYWTSKYVAYFCDNRFEGWDHSLSALIPGGKGTRLICTLTSKLPNLPSVTNGKSFRKLYLHCHPAESRGMHIDHSHFEEMKTTLSLKTGLELLRWPCLLWFRWVQPNSMPFGRNSNAEREKVGTSKLTLQSH